MSYIKLIGPAATPLAPGVGLSGGLAGCGCSAPRLPARMSRPVLWGGVAPGLPAPGLGFDFDLASYGLGTGTVVAGLAILIGGLLLFGPGARERSGKLKDENSRHRDAIKDENRRHREEITSIKGRYTRLPRAVTYDREVS